MKIKASDKYEFLEKKATKSYIECASLLKAIIISPRWQRCSICYRKPIDKRFVYSMAGKPICEQCFIKAILEAEEKLKEKENG